MEWFMTNIFHRLKDNIFKPSNDASLDLGVADNVSTTLVGKIGMGPDKSLGFTDLVGREIIKMEQDSRTGIGVSRYN